MSQELYTKGLDSVKQKKVHTYEYISHFEKFKEKFQTKKVVIMNMKRFLKFGIYFKYLLQMETMKD